MSDEGPPADERARALRDELDAAVVARDDLFAGLASIGGIGDVDVTGDTASVEITLPVPSRAVRETIAREVERVATSVEGVAAVDLSWRPAVPDAGRHVDMLPAVDHVIAVASGKGGVGKSTVAANLAVALADAGAAVGLLDADVYGPNAPSMLGLSERTPATTRQDRIRPRERHGVQVMSMDFLLGEDDPIIWRGPMVDDVLKQLAGDVAWGDLDYLVVDLPPGTGDAQMTLVQHFPLTGAVVVTTPQQVAVDNARRGLEGLARYDVPVLGVVENMAGFRCPDCGTDHDVFGSGGGRAIGEEFDVPVLAQIPLDPGVSPESDDNDGRPPGVTLPGVGRLQLPRTREEREGGPDLPPVALRESPAEAREATRLLATRVAARVNALAVSGGRADEPDA